MDDLTNVRDLLEKTRKEDPESYNRIMEQVAIKKREYLLHGGHRENAGREKSLYPKITCSFSLPNEIVIVLEEYSKENNMSKSKALEELVRKGILNLKGI